MKWNRNEPSGLVVAVAFGGGMDRTWEAHHWRLAMRRGLGSGSLASLTSAVALSLCSARDDGSPAGAVNAPSQWVWGIAQGYARAPTLKHTAVGFAVHHLMSVFWGVLHERTFHRASTVAQYALAGAATAAAAYLVDYHVAPRRLRPGFRKHLRAASLFTCYAAFGAGLAAAGALRDSPVGAAWR